MTSTSRAIAAGSASVCGAALHLYRAARRDVGHKLRHGGGGRVGCEGYCGPATGGSRCRRAWPPQPAPRSSGGRHWRAEMAGASTEPARRGRGGSRTSPRSTAPAPHSAARSAGSWPQARRAYMTSDARRCQPDSAGRSAVGWARGTGNSPGVGAAERVGRTTNPAGRAGGRLHRYATLQTFNCSFAARVARCNN
jgi:hypothetical protein